MSAVEAIGAVRSVGVGCVRGVLRRLARVSDGRLRLAIVAAWPVQFAAHCGPDAGCRKVWGR